MVAQLVPRCHTCWQTLTTTPSPTQARSPPHVCPSYSVAPPLPPPPPRAPDIPQPARRMAPPEARTFVRQVGHRRVRFYMPSAPSRNETADRALSEFAGARASAVAMSRPMHRLLWHASTCTRPNCSARCDSMKVSRSRPATARRPPLLTTRPLHSACSVAQRDVVHGGAQDAGPSNHTCGTMRSCAVPGHSIPWTRARVAPCPTATSCVGAYWRGLRAGSASSILTWASIMAEGHLRPQPGERAGAAMACRGARWGYMLSCSHWQLIATELVATGGGEHAPPS